MYVVGFLFTPGKSKVVVIRKKKPAWQAGRCNGVGGKIERFETPYQAMCREFEEEAGVEVADWEEYVTLVACNKPGPPSTVTVHFFRSFDEDGFRQSHSTTDEEIIKADVRSIITGSFTFEIIPNLRWLIPMAADLDLKVPILISERV